MLVSGLIDEMKNQAFKASKMEFYNSLTALYAEWIILILEDSNDDENSGIQSVWN